MLKNIERLQIQAKSFENAWRSIFFVKVESPQSATYSKNNLHYNCFSIDFSTFKEQPLIEENFKKKKKKVKNLKYNVYYVTQGVLLFIFSCCTW